MEQNVNIPVDISQATYQATSKSGPKVADRRTGVQKIDQRSGLPMWSTELVQIGLDGGARVISVTTLGQTAPVVSIGQTVVPEGLEALPWESRNNGEVRSGIAYRAKELRVPSTV